MVKWSAILMASVFTSLVGSASATESPKKLFNDYILEAVALISEHRQFGGYSLHEALTQDLLLNGNCCIKAVPHPKASWPEGWQATMPLPTPADHKTMCVAAIHEIIVEAVNLYVAEKHDASPIQKRSMAFWDGSTKRAIKPYLYMYAGVQSYGTANALRRFGMGAELPFASLTPGSFINFNRPHSGHAVVFLGYIDRAGALVQNYGPTVAGFKYFSAQGAGKADAGFGFRWAYFAPFCPDQNASKPRDCEVLRSNDQKVFNSGVMYAPSEWSPLEDVMEALNEKAVENLQKKYGGRTPSAEELMHDLSNELETELPFSPNSRLDGITTD